MQWGFLNGNNVLFQVCKYAQDFFGGLTYYSVALAVFNLIPVPPLDGSRVLFAFLPSRYYFKVMQYERYIMLVFLVLVYTGAFDMILGTGVENVLKIFDNLCQPIMQPLANSILG